MSQFDLYKDLFEYDLWANLKWIDASKSIGGESILTHILVAQERWLARCAYRPWEDPEEPDLAARATRINAGFLNYLRNVDFSEIITYRNLDDDEFTQPLEDILRHVINHGTYHRGELRGLFKAAGREDFEDTDYIGYCRLHH